MLTLRQVLCSTAAVAALSMSAAVMAGPGSKGSRPRPAPTATPTPTPAAAPTPTPLAPLAADTTLDDLTQDNTFAAYQSTVKQQYAPSGPNAGKPTSYGNYARATVQMKYDFETDSYIVRDTGNASATTTFGPGQITSSNASYTNYSRVVGGTTHTLTLLNPGATNPTIQLSYASYGHWRAVTPGGGNFGNTAQSDTYFVYGFKTPKADMPTTGTGYFSTLFDGTFTNTTTNYDIDGTGSLTAQFDTGTLTFTSTLTGTPISGSPIAFGALNGSGTIKSNASSFAATGSNGTYSMNLAGYFFGPTATEVGGVFSLQGRRTGPDAGSGSGAMVGGLTPP